MLVDITPSSMFGSLYGTMGMVDIIMSSVSAVPASFVWDFIGPEWVFYFRAAVCLVSVGYLYLFLKDSNNSDEIKDNIDSTLKSCDNGRKN